MASSVFINPDITNGSASSSLIPIADNTYDFGSATFQWRSLYLGTSVVLANAATVSWSDVVLSRGAANRLDLASGDSLNLVDGTLTQNKLALGVTSGDGIILSNSTAAAAGAQQLSPRLRLTGQGWKTDATAASQTVDWALENLPVQGAAAPTANLLFKSQINAGGYNTRFTLLSGGDANLAGSLSVNGATVSVDNLAIKASSNGFGFSLYPSGGGSTAVVGFRQSSVASGGHVFLRDAAGAVNTVEFFGDQALGGTVAKFSALATNDDPTENLSFGRIATTDATVTTLYTLTIPATTTYFMEAKVYARRTGGTAGTAEDGAGYIRVATIKNAAGTATLIGAVAAVVTQEDQAAWDCTIDVTGATARVRVTGAVDNSITWHATVRAYPVSS